MVPVPKQVDGSLDTKLVQVDSAHGVSIRPNSISHVDPHKLELIVSGVLQSFSHHVESFSGGLGGLEIDSVSSEGIELRVDMPVNQTLHVSFSSYVKYSLEPAICPCSRQTWMRLKLEMWRSA
jgi:hypothetical protein